MAKNLLKSLTTDDQLHVFDISSESTSNLVANSSDYKAPITVSKSVKEVARNADVIVTMLPAPKHVDLVYADVLQVLDNNSGKVFVDSSTIDVKTSLKTAKSLEKLGSYFFDAPVSGGVVGATNGTLTFMIGGGPTLEEGESASASSSPQSLEIYSKDVVPLLSSMGARLIPCGGPGLGLAAKLSNNYLLALNNIAAAESFQLARSLGLSLPLYSQIVSSSTGKCWSTDVNNPVPGVLPNAPASNDYLNGFGLQLMKKDLGLAIDAAKEVKLPLLLAEGAWDVYSQVEKDEYCKTRDMSVIYKYIEDRHTK